jgi:N-ethylmaleimide reductase
VVLKHSLVAGALNRLGLAYLHVMDPVGPDGSAKAPQMLPLLRERFRGPLMTNGGFSREAANEVIARGLADLVAFGAPYLANPDLPERLARGTPLNTPDVSTFYGGSERGYTDYPALAA